MAVYDYRCTDCEEQFEKLVRTQDDEPEITCPSCQSKNVKRLPSMFGWFGLGRRGMDSWFSAGGS